MLRVECFTIGSLPTNCYAVYDDENKKAVLVDIAESGGEIIKKWLTDNGMNLCGVLLTHGHFDHCGGVKKTISSDCKVYCHKDDVYFAQNAKSHTFYGIHADNCPVTDNFDIEDGILKIDEFQFRIIHTPGHTPGSVIYIIDKYMLSGDTLFRDSIGRTDFDGGNALKMQESLKKIKALQNNYIILPGHGDFSELDYEKTHNYWLNR